MKQYFKSVLPAHIYDAEEVSENAKTVLAAILIEDLKNQVLELNTRSDSSSKWVAKLAKHCELDEYSVMESLMELVINALIFIDASNQEEPCDDPIWEIFPWIDEIANPHWSNAFERFIRIDDDNDDVV